MTRDDDKWYALRFGIKRSVRYHERREAHYDRLRKLTNVLAILLAGLVLAEATSSFRAPWATWLAIAGMAFGVGDLIIGFSQQANDHRNLKRRWIDLERASHRAESSPDAIRDLRLQIESEEPPVFKALDLLCHNELMVADGHREGFAEIPWYARLSAQWIRWPDIGIRSLPSPGE